MMRFEGPERYQLFCSPKKFSVLCALGTPRFSGIAARKGPKLYIVSVKRRPVYVGVTRQTIRARLRYGFSADGRHGYHGYAFRHILKRAQLYVWSHADAPSANPSFDVETIEAEVVHHIRLAGQWPLFQTEIHFRPSKVVHRRIAQRVLSHFRLRKR